MPLLILFKVIANFFSIKPLNRYLANKKLTNAPKEDAKEVSISPGMKPKSDPINNDNNPATGNARTEIKKYIKKKYI